MVNFPTTLSIKQSGGGLVVKTLLSHSGIAVAPSPRDVELSRLLRRARVLNHGGKPRTSRKPEFEPWSPQVFFLLLLPGLYCCEQERRGWVGLVNSSKGCVREKASARTWVVKLWSLMLISALSTKPT